METSEPISITQPQQPQLTQPLLPAQIQPSTTLAQPTQSEPDSEPEPETKPEPQPEPQLEPQSQPQPQPKPLPQPQPELQPQKIQQQPQQQPQQLPHQQAQQQPDPQEQQTRKPKFTLKSLEPADGKQDEFVVTSIGQQEYRVTRTFHDFQFLEQQLFHSGQCLYGYILPPFPQQLTSHSGDGCSLPGYGRFVSNELQLFHWLRLVLEHPIFGHSGLVEPFLTEVNLPPPGKIVKPLSFIKSIQDTIDSRKYAHKDCDIFFQNERDWSMKVHEYMQLALDAFNSTINARHSLSQVLAHLSAALSVPIGDNSGLNKISLDTNLAFSRVLDGYREYVEAETIDGASTLGASLSLWTRFVEAEKEMLKQRTCLLVDYESANRNFDRARYQQRKPEVEETKWNAERAFEKCSEIARGEIKRFQSSRVRDLSEALNNYKTSQLALAREHYEKLSELYQQVTDELTTVNDLPA